MEMTGFITKPNARIFRECGWLEICRPSLTIHVNLLWLFPSQNERHYIMQVVCEATQCTHNPVNSIGQCALFSLGLNDRPQRPVVLFSALSFFLSALSFFSALSFSESLLVSSGFYQRYFELEVAESVQLSRTSPPSWIYVTDFGMRVRLR